ncbi:MAG TPA: acyltransferase [Bacteroidales bacterium]|nr:acyltransferase [Bacteroidales bacterium]HPF02528.1 acyltransferase [Bacteroidales bacterium]HPJ58363.1 acyltransferase [Bacteroidales bacterium]HPR10831.1 acyltransferase [Bacteroidales bacterium]HRW84209.1 acyltransferase [Bacteroidales bacterium]
MTTWKGKTRGGLAGYMIFVSVLRYSGLSAAYFLLRFVALYFFLFNPRSFRTIREFYRKRLGYKPLRSITAVYTNYYRFGQVLLDRIALMAGFRSEFSFIFEGEEYLQRMVDEKTGGLLISGHTGNFEMAGYMLERLNAVVNVIMFDAEHQNIKSYLDTVTERNFRVIVIKEDNSHIYEINRAFREKELVCIHGDRFLPDSKKLPVPFMGEEAFFPTGPFYLAMKFNVPVSFVFAMKEDAGQYHFYASRTQYYTQEGLQQKRDLKILEIIKQYAGEFEAVIRKYPEQWFNYYDFWEKDE